eukprot:gene2620-3248_t
MNINIPLFQPQHRPSNIGILAMDIYFPQTYVNQTELEIFDGVSSGKYTKGLGQTNMAFSGDREDIVSMSLSAIKLLMDKYNIPYQSIGRLEVGTETIIDKSKSVKSSLMQLFQEHGNSNIEGIDTINACYGGTNAIFNSVQWIESSYWDGRYAMVVTGDIAVYEKGPARPTGGAGVAAILIGPDAPIVMETGLRGVHMENVYDFYKPDLLSEYPYVDGKLSIECYLRALDKCYHYYKQSYHSKLQQQHLIHHSTSSTQQQQQQQIDQCFSMQQVDYAVFHSPYNRLVEKSFARLLYNDYLVSSAQQKEDPRYKEWKAFESVGLGKESYLNPKLESVSLKLSQEEYKKKVVPSTLLSKELGNSYCGSVYSGLLSLFTNVKDLDGKRVLVFSYGSGLAASFFSFRVRFNPNNPKFPSPNYICEKANILDRLSKRVKVSPVDFSKILEVREQKYKKIGAFIPSDSIDALSPGTFYLSKVDDKLRRYYQLKPQINSKL